MSNQNSNEIYLKRTHQKIYCANWMKEEEEKLSVQLHEAIINVILCVVIAEIITFESEIFDAKRVSLIGCPSLKSFGSVN